LITKLTDLPVLKMYSVTSTEQNYE